MRSPRKLRQFVVDHRHLGSIRSRQIGPKLDMAAHLVGDVIGEKGYIYVHCMPVHVPYSTCSNNYIIICCNTGLGNLKSVKVFAV